MAPNQKSLYKGVARYRKFFVSSDLV